MLLFALSSLLCYRWFVGNLRSELGRKNKEIEEIKTTEENRRKETARHPRGKHTQRENEGQ